MTDFEGKMISLSVEKLYAAMEAAGMKVDHVAMDNAVKIAAQNMADAIDGEVLAELLKVREVSVPRDEQEWLWKLLMHEVPYDSQGSLHITENHYMYNGVQYVVYWELGSKSHCPMDITILKEQE